ncbi:hypothetical protein IFM89_021380 [Coptis chinensis]|uniref:Embryo-specific protein 3 n=1 Tax=Coptis chinensis TaxID=261450 RepID=A0A835M104_9MAGN|nr:hypothetical protein IFM89_021380 [Coptis chinensis]
MVKLKVASVLLIFALLFIVTQASNSINPQPQILKSLKTVQNTQVGSRCSYTVRITTSCSSTRFTRDMIGLAFGDAYGYQVYVPRLDDPYSRAFERCSTDTYQISGPCMYNICYLYLLRMGSDGWKPESVTINGYYSQPATFYYNTFIPYGVWFGFDFCNSQSMISSM